MNLEHRLLAALMRARAILILGLSLASGWTTWKGLALFMIWPIALILTVAVQAILVIATYQLSNMYVAASPRRYLAVAGGLAAAFSVSVFFSYFTFYSYNEGRRIGLRKFERTRIEVNQYIRKVLDARSSFVKGQKDLVDRLNREAQDAREGRLAGERIRLGEGPMARSRQNLADQEARRLGQELAAGELEALANATTAALALLTGEDAVLDPAKQNTLRDRLAEFQSGATKWLIPHGIPLITAPRLPPLSEYQVVRPSPACLSSRRSHSRWRSWSICSRSC